MIVRIRLRGESPLLLPKHYNHILQAFFYKNMDPQIAKFLHDFGFIFGGRRFKLFTFSKVMGKLLGREGDTLIFEPLITLYFASPLLDLVKSSVKAFLFKEELYLGKNKLSLESIGTINPQVSTEELSVRCFSPITVYKTPPGEKRFRYFSPFEEEFYKLIEENLKKKYNLLYGKPYEGELSVSPIKIKPSYRKKVVFKGTLIEAWEGYFSLKGKPQILRIALEAGLGAKNSAGFGMVEKVSESKV